MIFGDFSIILLVAFVHVNVMVSCDGEYTICNTNACNRIVKRLHGSIDYSVKPCEDIYRHVCGKWIQRHPIDNNGQGYRVKPNLEKLFRTRFQKILSEPSQSQDSNLLLFAKRIYKKCMRPSHNDTVALTALIKIINSIGVWPLITRDANALGNTTWQEISKKVDSTFAFNAIYTLEIQPDGNDPERYTVALAQPATFFPWKYDSYKRTPDPQKVDAYHRYIKNVVAEITASTGTQLFTKRKAKDIDDLLKFEIGLLKIFSTPEEWISNYYTTMSFTEIQNLYDKECPTKNGKINWAEIVRNRLTASEVTFDRFATVRIYSLKYFLRLAHFLDKTSTRTIVNYLLWHFVRSLLPFVTPKMLQYATTARRVVRNEKEKSDADRCLETPNLFPVVTNEYLKRYFPASERRKVLEILQELNTEVMYQAHRASWMDTTNKNTFVTMAIYVGHPDWYNDTGMQGRYATLDLSDRLLLQDVLNINKFSANEAAKKVGTIVNAKEWANDYYLHHTWIYQTKIMRPDAKLTLLPIGMLYNGLMNSERPEAMNYGTVGFNVGYDISDGFGSLYTAILSKKTNSSLTPAIVAHPEIRKCIEDFYNASVGHNAVGRSNRNDSYVDISTFIGDLSATSAAWNTWENRKRKITNKDVRLPGLLRYSSDQLFFIAITYNYCEHKMLSDKHVRLWSAFANSEAFSKAFNCPKSSPMNLPRKCEIWK